MKTGTNNFRRRLFSGKMLLVEILEGVLYRNRGESMKLYVFVPSLIFFFGHNLGNQNKKVL